MVRAGTSLLTRLAYSRVEYVTWVMRDLADQANWSVDAYRGMTSDAHPNLLRCVEQSSHIEMLLWAAVVGIATSSVEAVRTQYASRVLTLARSLDVVDLRNSWKRYNMVRSLCHH